MLFKTHLAFGILMILVFLNYVSNKIVFAIMVIVATILPDLDSRNSKYGNEPILMPLQAVTHHRGFIHSFTTAAILAGLIAIKWPVASFGFFVGYSIHLVMDSFTKKGIQPFWPFKWESKGPITTGGRIEEILFLIIIALDFLIFLALFLWG